MHHETGVTGNTATVKKYLIYIEDTKNRSVKNFADVPK